MKKQILFFVSLLSLGFATTVWAGGAEDTRLIDAIRANNPAAAREAIESGADVNLRAINRNTPLHLTILNPISPERKEIIMLLVRNGARINVKNNAGQLPADLARTMPDFEDIQALLGETECPICGEPITPEKDFVRGNDLFGCDPRHIFHRACLFDEAGTQRTVQCPTCRATRDETAAAAERNALLAHYTATEAHPDTEEVHPEVDLTQPETEEAHPMLPPSLLINAIRHRNLDQVEDLLNSGRIDIEAYENGHTALMWAARLGLTDIVNTLLTHGANVNAGSPGWRPLMLAIGTIHVELIETLLTHGADVNEADAHGETALISATRMRGSPENAHTIYTLLMHGANADAADERGRTALMYAASHDNIDAIEILLDRRHRHRANIDASDSEGRTALMEAIQNNHPEAVSRLLEHGANVNASDRFGVTALMLATRKDSPKMVSMLLKHGAIVNATDSNGDTVLTYYCSDEVKRLLIAHSARKGHPTT